MDVSSKHSLKNVIYFKHNFTTLFRSREFPECLNFFLSSNSIAQRVKHIINLCWISSFLIHFRLLLSTWYKIQMIQATNRNVLFSYRVSFNWLRYFIFLFFIPLSIWSDDDDDDVLFNMPHEQWYKQKKDPFAWTIQGLLSSTNEIKQCNRQEKWWTPMKLKTTTKWKQTKAYK